MTKSETPIYDSFEAVRTAARATGRIAGMEEERAEILKLLEQFKLPGQQVLKLKKQIQERPLR